MKVNTNEEVFIEVFGKDVLDTFHYYLTHVLTNSNVTEKFNNWLASEYRNYGDNTMEDEIIPKDSYTVDDIIDILDKMLKNLKDKVVTNSYGAEWVYTRTIDKVFKDTIDQLRSNDNDIE